MKLQYLGDARDAFKWDLLHWICSQAKPQFGQLVYVPLLTPDREGTTEGRIHHTRFACRPKIQPFIRDLSKNPRTLKSITALGECEPTCRFTVNIFASERTLNTARWKYWDGFNPSSYDNALVFFDPDTGLETRTQHGPQWLLHCEIARCLERLTGNSAVVIYQHRPRRTWKSVFEDFATDLTYAKFAVSAFEPNLAFIAIANSSRMAVRVDSAMKTYAAAHPVVKYQVLREDENIHVKPLP